MIDNEVMTEIKQASVKKLLFTTFKWELWQKSGILIFALLITNMTDILILVNSICINLSHPEEH